MNPAKRTSKKSETDLHPVSLNNVELANLFNDVRDELIRRGKIKPQECSCEKKIRE